mgnify:CR=1 FL=1
MPGTVRRMKTRALLEQYGVTSIKQLCDDLEISRQYGWNIWHGHSGIGPVMMEKLHAKYGIPYADLMGLDPIRPRQPRGRPKRKRDE